MAGSFRILPSTKILIGAVVVMGLGWFGYNQITGAMILNEKFTPIKPDRVNIVGIDTSAGYYIIVANQVAQLVLGERSKNFEAPEHGSSGGDAEKKRRVPIRELLLSLEGDEKALARLVMSLNELSDAELPSYPVIWKAEDMRKALSGDKALRTKLEQDLNVTLEGSPTASLKVSGIQEGIVIESPVSVKVPIEGKQTVLTAIIREEFRSRFMAELDNTLSDKKELTPAMITGYYRDAAQKLLDNPDRRENVRSTLEGRIDPKRLAQLAELPERVLNSVTVIVNSSLMESATSKEYAASDGKPLFDITVKVTEEGRKRLWQYSKRHVGAQILVVWDGIAVAAPTISHELAFPEVTISQLTDPTLASDTAAAINELAKSRKSNP